MPRSLNTLAGLCGNVTPKSLSACAGVSNQTISTSQFIIDYEIGTLTNNRSISNAGILYLQSSNSITITMNVTGGSRVARALLNPSSFTWDITPFDTFTTYSLSYSQNSVTFSDIVLEGKSDGFHVYCTYASEFQPYSCIADFAFYVSNGEP